VSVVPAMSPTTRTIALLCLFGFCSELALGALSQSEADVLSELCYTAVFSPSANCSDNATLACSLWSSWVRCSTPVAVESVSSMSAYIFYILK
jgi:hypothetical protein